MAQQKEIAKDIKSAAELEQQLLISYAQKGVSVLDIYSSEWGPCKAIVETFRRLYTDAGDAVHLRFFTVECNQVLESLKNPSEGHRHQRPKNTEAIKDALPEFWQPILQEQCGKSKPFFLFYKEGKKMASIEGVDTPAIRALIKDLCTVKTPASEFITNAKLQEMWDEQFNPEESEVSFDKFVKGLQAHCKLTVNLNDDEKKALLEVLGLTKDVKERIVTADALQKWIGEDETNTVPQALKTLLPDYEERANAVIAEREAEDKRRKEAEEENKRAEESRKAEVARQEEENRKNSQNARIEELNKEIHDLALKAGYSKPEEVGATTHEEEAAKDKAKHWKPAPFAAPVFASVAAVQPVIDSIAAAPSLWSLLAQHGGDLKTAAASLNASGGIGQFVALLAQSNADDAKLLTGAAFDFASHSKAGFADLPTLIASLSSQANTTPLYAKISKPTEDQLLAPFTPLFKAPGEGLVAVTDIHDVAYLGDDLVCTLWYTKLQAQEENLKFVEYVQWPAFHDAVVQRRAHWHADDEKLEALGNLRLREQERATLRGDKAEKPAEHKDEKPAEKPATPAEKPAEKPVTPAEKPAEKPGTPAEKPADAKSADEKPAEKPATPAEKPAEKPADEKPAEKPATPAEKPAEKPATPAEKPAEKPGTPAEKPAEKPADEKPATPAEKPAEKPGTPAEKPADEKPTDEKPATPAESSAKPAA